MLGVALGLMVVCVCSGCWLFLRPLLGRLPPLPVMLIHGAAGWGVLIALAIRATMGRSATIALVALVPLALVGLSGLLILARRLRRRPVAMAWILSHAVVAIFALLLAVGLSAG